MANIKDKRFYWLKLDRNFFKRHDIKIIENMPNGKDYLIFYLKLLCESIDHDGKLRFSETIPYDINMLATITNTNVDIAKSALTLFENLKMVSVLDDFTVYMGEIQKLMGSETYWAKQKRIGKDNQDQSEENEYKKLEIFQQESNSSISISLSSSLSNKYKDILDYWNNKDIIKHTKVTKEMEKTISQILEAYRQEQILTFIDRYATVLKDTTYFFDYHWTLVDFLKRKNGIYSFTDDGSKWNDYLNHLKGKEKSKQAKKEIGVKEESEGVFSLTYEQD